jgi:hypothetical protein
MCRRQYSELYLILPQPDRVLDKFRPAAPKSGPDSDLDRVLDKFRPAGPDGEPICGPDWTGPCFRQI